MSVKVERYIEISREGGSIVINPASSVYLLLPSDIKKRLKEYGVDLEKKEHRKNISIEATLVCERTKDSNPFEIKVVYSFKKLKPSPLTMEEKTVESV